MRKVVTVGLGILMTVATSLLAEKPSGARWDHAPMPPEIANRCGNPEHFELIPATAVVFPHIPRAMGVMLAEQRYGKLIHLGCIVISFEVTEGKINRQSVRIIDEFPDPSNIFHRSAMQALYQEPLTTITKDKLTGTFGVRYDFELLDE